MNLAALRQRLEDLAELSHGALALLNAMETDAHADERSPWRGEFFTLAELVASDKADELGIDNTPGPDEVAALNALIVEVADPLRRSVGPLKVTSGYRCPELNRAIGSKDSSQHILGEAMDLRSLTGASSRTLADRAYMLGLPVHQCIHYHPTRDGNFHLSHVAGGPNRREFLYAPEGGGYVPYDPTEDPA